MTMVMIYQSQVFTRDQDSNDSNDQRNDDKQQQRLTDPGPSLRSRPIPTAFLLLPNFILQILSH